MKQTLSITRKELNSYFSSPMALIFVGVFLAATLFTFFWVDEFFARGIADVRSLFRWMPVLMIFLVAALTMRQWSEEQQAGTLEILFTMPVKVYQLVMGKFLAVLGLVVVALLLTLFLPITISFIGNPDVGPIVGGYLAAILMASAYIAIGLFVSSRTGNQIVALIVTVLICGLFQLAGTAEITDLFDTSTAEILRSMGTGSRFESIERGVVDVRDLLYYATITVIFLALNILSLDSKRWGHGKSTENYRFNTQLTVGLLTVNLLILNVILYPFHSARLDLTENQEYSLSPVTKDLLQNLQEPLLIRGYFSERNHPLLAPLVPQIRDLLEEYRIAAGGDNVTVEIIDPLQDPEKEAEANQTYGIRPSPLQTSDRYGAQLINVYFDILIRYGDQNVVLNYNDLITFDQFGNGDFEVRLRNLEYDLTRSIKKVVFGFQSVDTVLASLPQPARLTLYYTPSTLPESLTDAPNTIQQVTDSITSVAAGQFIYEPINMDQTPIDQNALYNQYGIQPLAENFLSPDVYYLHMVLEAGDKIQVIYPAVEISENEVRSQIEGALQRASTGFLKVVGVWTPPDVPQQDMFGQAVPSLQQYNTVPSLFQEDYEVQVVDLNTVPGNIDVLLVIAPENLTDVQRYSIDQYLMRGGTVFVAAGNYKITQDQFSGALALQPVVGGLQEMLTHYGITVEQSLVMDEQNAAFPSPVQRNVGGIIVQEIQTVDYPFFVDVRSDGMAEDNPILSSIPAVALNWVSPITLDAAKNEDRDITTLMRSTDRAWVTTDTNAQPDFVSYPEYGFQPGGNRDSYPLAVIVEGSFESFFKDKELPTAPIDPNNPEAAPAAVPTSTLENSPETARLIVVGSSEFVNDNIFQLMNSFNTESAMNTLQFIQNTVDWSTEDTDLLSIRSRGASVRVLDNLTETEQSRWEYLNYGLALASLLLLGILWQVRRRAERPMELVSAEG